jgi:chromosome segregation ATPase
MIHGMVDQPGEPEVRVRISNAIAIVESMLGREPGARQAFLAAIEALRAARGAIGELEAQLDIVTAPERAAARDVLRLGRELEAARQRIAALEAEVRLLRTKLDVEAGVHADEQRRLRELEHRAKEFDAVLMDDDRAFGKFMERELDRKKPKAR